MDNNKEVIDSTTSETQEQELELTLDGTEDADALKEKLEKTEAFAKQAIARAKKAEAEAKALKAKATDTTEKVDTSKTNVQANGSVTFDEALELRLQGYSKDAVEFISRNGGIKSLDNPIVKAALNVIKEQEKAEKAIPDTNSGKSEVEKKYTQEQLNNMSAEELYKILPKSNR